MATTRPNMLDPKSDAFAGPCPSCGGPVPNLHRHGEFPGALSRLDNETYICSDCGTTEAMFQFLSGGQLPLPAFDARTKVWKCEEGRYTLIADTEN